MYCRSSLQGATCSVKTDPSNAYQQQNTKGTFHKRSGLKSTNTQQGNYEETLMKQTVVDNPLLEDTAPKQNVKVTQKRNTTKSQQNRKNDGDQIIYISSLEQQIQNQNKIIELLKKIWRYYRIKSLVISVRTIKIQKVLVTQEQLIGNN